ncbi:type II toxin-antitoxin system death-on-curing family toxin [Nocardia farcinica]|uniref:type II toxin-antitoxin system death-on-curing family toxin n=1 Tax=Nocardia farcinica TaxID=37329 RepID=UPI0024544FE7|nr:type II toxin-antitoxin system death-on-curing family toxin [Nocardia farcinica]
MTWFLTREHVITAGSIACGSPVEVGDYGLLDAAIARPQATVFGVDAYPTLFEKAAALLQSIARNHALLDGNKRTAWAAAWVFLELNGIELDPVFDVDEAERFINEVAQDSKLRPEAIAVDLEAFAKH